MSSLRLPVRAGLVTFAMVGVALLTWCMKPADMSHVPGSLASAVPTSFGDWREIKTDVAQINPTVGEAVERGMDNPYDEIVMRTYSNSRGDVVMLALAYGVNQRQEVKIHRPELCYVSQGFRLLERSEVTLHAGASRPISAQRMLVQAPGRAEAVSYWIRIGNTYSRSPWATRFYIFKQGLRGHSLDGILVRVSQVVEDRGHAGDAVYARQEAFIADLTRAMGPDQRGFLLVDPGTDPQQG